MALWSPVQGQDIKVSGLLKIGSTHSGILQIGTVQYDSTQHDFEVWNGLFWGSLTGFQFESDEIMDVDSNTYRTVKIGDQIWMVDNLRTGRYRDGSPVTHILDDTEWKLAHYGGWSWYDHLDTLDVTLGKLYNHHAIQDYRGLCPTDWHVPTDQEWNILINYLDTDTIDPNIIGIQSDTAGIILKDVLTQFWDNIEYAGDNHSGFSARGSGIRFTNGLFLAGGLNAYYWSSSIANGNILIRAIYGQSSQVERGKFPTNYGLSIRCIHD